MEFSHLVQIFQSVQPRSQSKVQLEIHALSGPPVVPTFCATHLLITIKSVIIAKHKKSIYSVYHFSIHVLLINQKHTIFKTAQFNSKTKRNTIL